MLKFIIPLVLFIGAGWALGLYLGGRAGVSDAVADDLVEAVRSSHDKDLREMSGTMGRQAMDKRFKIAEIRDGYTPKLEDLDSFEAESSKSHPVAESCLRLLEVSVILPERRLHDDMVGLLKIGAYEREMVDHILTVGWTHIAIKVRSVTTVDASNPKEVYLNIGRASDYGMRIREIMRQKIAEVIGPQRMTVLFKFLDTEDWIMDYGRGTKLRFYQRGKNKWGFVAYRAGYGYIPPELAGHFHDMLPQDISKHIKVKWRVVPTLTESWDVDKPDAGGQK